MLVGVEPEPLLEAIVEIEALIDSSGSPLPLRGGFSSGRVILIDGDDYIGTPVNLGARLCDCAEPRQILAPADTVEHLYTSLVARPIGTRAIAGFDDPVDLVELAR